MASIRSERSTKTAALLSFGFFLLMAPQSAQAQPPLAFFKNYFVTGDYVVRGASLWRKGINGQATALIPPLGPLGGADAVPPTADILAAFLYVQTAEKIQGSGIHHAKFTGHDLGPFTDPESSLEPGSGTFAKALVNWGTAPSPCWSVSYPGGRKLMTYRVDVLRFLPIDPVTQKQSLTAAHQIVVPDAGLLFGDDDEGKFESYKSDLPRALGASLVVVYRDRSKPFSGIMLYDGAFTKRAFARMDQPISGFYQASSDVDPRVKMSHIVGDGRLLFSERVYLDGDLIATNPFRSSSGPKWDNVTWRWERASPILRGAAETLVRVDPHTLLSDCLTYSAIVFRTTVQDSDDDGLINIWESSQSPLDDPNVPNDPATGEGYLPNLHAMGADPFVPDIFSQLDYLYTDGDTMYGGVTKLQHSHLPSLTALTLVGDAFANAPTPIRVHFDVGNNYQGSQYVIPAAYARGGQSLSETKLCEPAPTSPDLTDECPVDPLTGQHQMPGQYTRYPGTVGWKTGFAFLKDALLGFDRNRKDIFRYILAGHFIGLPVDPCLDEVKRPDGAVEFVSNFDCQENEPNFHVPRTNSGIADFPGGELLLTLGGFDNEAGRPVGKDFQVASTIMHEWGHNFLLTHGGVLPQPHPSTFLITREPNCKPNYFSVMNYLFQLRGLLDPDAIPRLDYAREGIAAINEFPPLEQSLFLDTTDLFRYRTGWYAPKSASYVRNLVGVKAATKHCDGSPLSTGEQDDLEADGGMVRIDATSVLGAIDWNANGRIGDGTQQDLNFNGTNVELLKESSNDWDFIRVNELGGRRNVGGYYIDTFGRNAVGPLSLDVGRGDIGRGDIGRGDIGRGDIGRGDIGRGDIGLAIGRGDIGRGDIGRGDIGRGDIGLPNGGRGDIGRGDIGRGDIGHGGGDLDVGDHDEPPGDMTFETATAAEGDAEVGPPAGLVACLTSESDTCVTGFEEPSVSAGTPVNLTWLAPNLGAALVVNYKIYRFAFDGAFVAPSFEDLPTEAIDMVGAGETSYVDYDAPGGVQLAYFIRATHLRPIDDMFTTMDCVDEEGIVVSDGAMCRFETAISNFDTVRTPAPSVPVTATAGSGSATYDGATHAPSACQVTGADTGDLTCADSPAAVGPDAGTTTIVPVVSGTGLGNFAITLVNGSFTIFQAPSTTAFGPAPSPTYPGGNFTVAASNNSGGAITYSKLSGPCTLVDAVAGTFSPTGIGNCVVQADTATTLNYLTSSAQQTVVIASSLGTILIYGPALADTQPTNEKTIAEAAGYGVVTKTAVDWSAMTTSDFASYKAIVFPDPHCALDPSPLATANANKATWSPAVTGRKVVIGTDPMFGHGEAAEESTLTLNAIAFAASGPSTGMYMSLSCYYVGSAVGTPVPVLDEFGAFAVEGGNLENVTITDPSHPVVAGLTDSSLSNWGNSVHETFTSFPSTWKVVAVETTGGGARPYIIVNNGTILIYGPSLASTEGEGAVTTNEQTVAEAAGYSVVVKAAAQWSGMTTAQFSAFDAIIFPDPNCSNPEEAPLLAADSNKALWSPAVTGRKVVIGTDPVFHIQVGTTAAGTLTRNAIQYAASGSKTGMYMSLSCYYHSVSSPTAVSALSEFGTFEVSGQNGCPNQVHIIDTLHPVMSSLSDSDLSGWGCSMHEWFNSYPETWNGLAEETSGVDASGAPINRTYIIAMP